jgi:hypothetical protein
MRGFSVAARSDRSRLAVSIVAVLLLAARGLAQVQGYPVEPSTPPFPVAPSVVPEAVLPPVVGLPVCPGPVPSCPIPVHPAPAAVPPGCDPYGRDRGPRGPCTAFPRTLLWEPPLAGLREPRFLAMPTTLSNSSTQATAETAVGNTVGLVRVAPAAWRTAIQFDVFAVVNSRFSDYDALVATDYRAGFPVSFARGPWHGKIGYEHTSTHLGDEIQERTGQVPINFIKDELVFGLGRYLFEGRWRVYGQAAWAFHQNIPGDPSPFRFGLGTEWVYRRATGLRGSPFAALNLDFDGAVDYDAALSLQAGWLWRDPDRRLAELRLFGQYFTGHSPYGQFFQTREDWFGLGIAIDY